MAQGGTPNIRLWVAASAPLVKIALVTLVAASAMGAPAAAAPATLVLIAGLYWWRNHILPGRVPKELASGLIGQASPRT